MNLVKVNPRRKVYPSTFSNFDNLFNDLFNHGLKAHTPVTKSSPAINVVEMEDGYRLEIAAPGFAKENFTVEVDNDILTIAGKLEQETKEGEKYTRREFNYTEFKRTFHLPETVNQDSINAEFENGILSLTLNLKEEVKPAPARQIEIA